MPTGTPTTETGTTTGGSTGTTGSGDGTTGGGTGTSGTGGTTTGGGNSAAFHDVQFPTNISFGSTGGPSFSTTVVGTDAGWEQRISRWDSARLSWECSHQIWDRARIDALIAFFRARRGKAFGFRFRDWSDYYVGMGFVPGEDAISYTAPAGAQKIATGDGATKVFQLAKTYTSGGVTETRKITRPDAATVRVYVGGVQMTAGWTLNASTGVLAFATAPAAGAVIAWAGKFDVPARFDTDEMKISIEAVQIGNWPSIPIVEIRE